MEMIERLSHLRTAKGLKVNKFILQPVVCSNKQMMTAFQNGLRYKKNGLERKRKMRRLRAARVI